MRVVILINGEIGDAAGAKALIRPDDVVIAADGGARWAAVLGVEPNMIIGDMDSIDPDELVAYEAQGVAVSRFNSDKDETDLELALIQAKEMGADEVLVLGAFGGRLDQSIANLLLGAYPDLVGMQVVYWSDGQWVYIVQDELEIEAPEGTTVSLIPIGGDVEGVTTRGLAWPLKGERLRFGATRGVSNVMEQEIAQVKIKNGTLLLVVGNND